MIIRNILRRVAERFYPLAVARPFTKYIMNLNRKGLLGVEIGVQRGRNAYNMLRLLDMRMLWLVDPYIWYKGSTESKSDSPRIWYNIAKRKLRHHHCKFLIYHSNVVNHYFRDDTLDFVYIDGNHNYGYVKEDIELYYPKLKVGGILGGHDYTASFPGVARAVHEFADKKGLKIYGHGIDWWVVKE